MSCEIVQYIQHNYIIIVSVEFNVLHRMVDTLYIIEERHCLSLDLLLFTNDQPVYNNIHIIIVGNSLTFQNNIIL